MMVSRSTPGMVHRYRCIDLNSPFADKIGPLGKRDDEDEAVEQVLPSKRFELFGEIPSRLKQRTAYQDVLAMFNYTDKSVYSVSGVQVGVQCGTEVNVPTYGNKSNGS